MYHYSTSTTFVHNSLGQINRVLLTTKGLFLLAGPLYQRHRAELREDRVAGLPDFLQQVGVFLESVICRQHGQRLVDATLVVGLH